MAFGDSLNTNDIVRSKISVWLNEVPDYADVKAAYDELGKTRAKARLLRRKIDDAEDTIITESNHPRSNDTRIAKLNATRALKQDLAELEAKEMELEMRVKFLEYVKTMYNAASFQSRALYE